MPATNNLHGRHTSCLFEWPRAISPKPRQQPCAESGATTNAFKWPAAIQPSSHGPPRSDQAAGADSRPFHWPRVVNPLLLLPRAINPHTHQQPCSGSTTTAAHYCKWLADTHPSVSLPKHDCSTLSPPAGRRRVSIWPAAIEPSAQRLALIPPHCWPTAVSPQTDDSMQLAAEIEAYWGPNAVCAQHTDHREPLLPVSALPSTDDNDQIESTEPVDVEAYTPETV